MPDNFDMDRTVLRCLRCKGKNLVRSGKEPYRFICEECGQHYFIVMQLQPVDPPAQTPLLESDAGHGTGTT